MTKIKICGITNLKDARAAVKLGVDYLGFIFYPKSPRYIKPEKASNIIRQLPKKIKTVGVFVDEGVGAVKKIAEITGIKLLQLHGDESQAYCKKFKMPIIKAFRIKDNFDIDRIKKYNVNFFLIDTYSPSKFGGTGKIFDWVIASRLNRFRKNIFLSGGLNPENVALAIKKIHPFAVDVSSGVERAPGKKDNKLMKKFVINVRTGGSVS